MDIIYYSHTSVNTTILVFEACRSIDPDKYETVARHHKNPSDDATFGRFAENSD
jgi:hypothetical protein